MSISLSTPWQVHVIEQDVAQMWLHGDVAFKLVNETFHGCSSFSIPINGCWQWCSFVIFHTGAQGGNLMSSANFLNWKRANCLRFFSSLSMPSSSMVSSENKSSLSPNSKSGAKGDVGVCLLSVLFTLCQHVLCFTCFGGLMVSIEVNCAIMLSSGFLEASVDSCSFSESWEWMLN